MHTILNINNYYLIKKILQMCVWAHTTVTRGISLEVLLYIMFYVPNVLETIVNEKLAV